MGGGAPSLSSFLVGTRFSCGVVDASVSLLRHSGFSGLTFAQVLPVAPRTADRDLQQLHQDFDRYRIEEEISSLRQNALPAKKKTVPRNEASQMNATFEFNNFIKLKSCL